MFAPQGSMITPAPLIVPVEPLALNCRRPLASATLTPPNELSSKTGPITLLLKLSVNTMGARPARTKIVTMPITTEQ